MGNNPSNLRGRTFDGTALQPKDVPPPSPSKTTKEAALSQFDFKILDERAIKAPKKLLRQTWWDLVDYLTENDSYNRLAKVRTIFRWITSYDIENYEIGDAPPANSPLEYFGKIQSDMGDYANLFFILCSVAHVKCVVIDGITKSSGYDVGEPFDKASMKAHWNAVYINKEWRLVDCFWASTCDFVDEGKMTRLAGQSRYTKTKAPRPQAAFDDDDEDGKGEPNEIHDEEPNEFYFFTDPDKLISTHLPRDPKWQLLVKSITEDEFETQAYLRERFINMEIKIGNDDYDKCKVIAKDGEAKLTFRLPQERSQYFRFKFHMYKCNSFESNKIHSVLERFIIFQHTKNRLKLYLRFPVAGKFKLDIFGVDRERYKTYDILCTYIFEVDVPVSECYPLPDNPLIGWGPGIDTEVFGLFPLTHVEAIITTEDGKLEIKVEGKRELALYMTLKNPFMGNKNLSKYVMLRWKAGEYILNTRLPKEGEYALNLYARDQNNTKESHNVLNYLIKCIGKEIKETPYPNLAQESLGAHPEAKSLGVECIGCEDGFVDAKEGKSKVEFQTKDDIQLLCELHANDVDSPERLRVNPNKANGRQAFALDLPFEGEYAMNVFGLLKNNPQKIHNIHSLLVHSGGRPIQQGVNKRTGSESKNFWKNIGNMDIEVITTKDTEVIVPVPFGVPNVVAFLERKGSGQPPSAKNVETITEEGIPLYKLKLGEYGEYIFNIYQRDDNVFIRNFMRYIIRRVEKEDKVMDNDLDIIMSTIKEERIKDGNDVSGIDSRKEDFVEHKKQRVDVGQKVEAARQLQKAVTNKNPDELKRAIDEYKNVSKTKNGVMDDPLLASAYKEYKTIKAKADLTEAYQNRELTELDKAIAQAKKSKDPSLDVQILLAQRLRERVAVMRRIRDTVMKTDPKTINEIRKYNTPPDGAHQSIAAALLMMGHPLKEVEDWKNCQKLLSKRGNESVRNKMAHFDARRVPKGHAEYAKGMMNEITLSQVEKSCPMASAFCQWAKQKIAQTEKEIGPVESATSDLEKEARRKREQENGKENKDKQDKTGDPKTKGKEKDQNKPNLDKNKQGKIVPLAVAQKGVKGNPNQGKKGSPTNMKKVLPKSVPLIIDIDENNDNKIDIKAIVKQPKKPPQGRNGNPSPATRNPKDKQRSPGGNKKDTKISRNQQSAQSNNAQNQNGGNRNQQQNEPDQGDNENKNQIFLPQGQNHPGDHKGRFPSESSNELNFDTPSELYTPSELSTVPSGEANVITFEDLFAPKKVNVKHVDDTRITPGSILRTKNATPVVKEQKPKVSYLARHHMKNILQPPPQTGHIPAQPIRKQKSDPEVAGSKTKPQVSMGYGARHLKRTALV